MPVELPCGQCIGCRLEKSRHWAVRCMHEASLHEDNCFLTLTYSDEELTFACSGPTLVKKDFQDFLKRLRHHCAPLRFRYYMCGEYGENFGRPHYHACVFGLDFKDKYLWFRRGENIVYRSETLEKIWGKGICSLGAVSFESAAYTARYVMKKQTGEYAREYYDGAVPEYNEMSRGAGKNDPDPRFRGGIGCGWLEKYKEDVYPDDFIVVNGAKCSVPRYYDKKLEAADDPVFDRVLRDRRVFRRSLDPEESLPDRLRVREKVTESKVGRLKREFKE